MVFFQVIKNERSINNRLNIALQRIHNNLIAESPVPGAPPVDQTDNLVSRSSSRTNKSYDLQKRSMYTLKKL